jgi:ABC-type polysaccharide/polyol phosphate transport system ATPase subunit
MTREAVLSVRAVSRKFCRDLGRSLRYASWDAARDFFVRRPRQATLRAGEFWALRDVSFELARGQSLAIMGRNGAGKSTLLKILLGSLRMTEGQTITRGRVAALTEHGLAFDPVLSGRENVYVSAAVLGIDRRRVREVFDDIVAFAGLEAFIDSPVQAYSTGMRARLGFSVAMYLEPDILLVDEVLAVGDLAFQRRCIGHAKQYVENGGALIFVSHNPHLVQYMCDRCLVLDAGAVVFDGDVVGGVARYLHEMQAEARSEQQTPSARGTPPQKAPVILYEDSGVLIEDFGIRPVGCDALCTWQPARVHVRFHCMRQRRVRWGFCLLSADLETIISCEGPHEAFFISPGEGELSGTIPRLPLTGGRYAIRVAITDPDTGLPLALRGFDELPLEFTVGMPPTVRNNYHMFTGDLIALDIEWDRMCAAEPAAVPIGGATHPPP